MSEHVLDLADGTRLACQLGGPADAPGLLLLQGQANNHHWWDGLRERFEAAYRTITFDWRGTGGSVADEEPAEHWSAELFAADAHAVVTAVGFERVRVYGTSMGGRVAQHLAADRPSVVSHLVLACTSPGGPHARERSREVRIALSQRDVSARRQALLELMYTPSWTGTRSNLLGDPTMSRAASRLHLRVSGNHDAWDKLPSISAPTLVLHGTEDLMAPHANADLIASRIPDARVHLTQGGRHGFFDEYADDLTPTILDFLA